MSTRPKPPAGSGPILKNTALAPIIYFDNVPVFGVSAGNLQVEVAARMLAPNSSGGVASDMVCTAHLRCSAAAAQSLIEALQKGLKMIEDAAKPASEEET